MLTNYIKIAFRNIQRNKLHSSINILGLSIGIAAVILILIYLRFEWSYDRFHENGKNIYRVAVESNWEGRIDNYYSFLAPMGPALKKDFPQVQNYTRMRKQVSGYFLSGNLPYKIEIIHHVDASFLKMFSFKVLAGDPDLALESPYSIVLTRLTAINIWKTDDVIGKLLQSDNKKTYTVTAIVEDPPVNSTINFNALISFSSLYHEPDMFMDWDGGEQYTTYIQLRENADPSHFEDLMKAFVKKYLGHTNQINYKLTLEPLDKIHLYFEPGYLFLKILQFGAVALLILIMGSANFINISLAQSVKRVKETGVRKVLGAGKGQIVSQFLVESFMAAVLAAVIGVSLIELILINYSHILGHDIPRSAIYSPYFLIFLISTTVFVAIFAGAVPAFYMASLTPARVFKNSLLSGHRKGRFRSLLLFLQFSISVVLIFGSFIIYQQQVYMRHKVLGLNKDNILVINLPTQELRANNQIIKDALQKLPFINHASLNSEIPYHGLEANGYLPEGFSIYKPFHVIQTDEDFLETFGINFIEGRAFSADIKTDKDACVINQTLAKLLEWKNPVGKTIERNGKHTVIGVVRDFHFATLHEKIEPLIIINSSYKGYLGELALRIDNEAISSGLAIQQIRDVISGIAPSAPFEYWFLDDAFDSLYRNEEVQGKILIYSTMLAILISFMGLYGLISIETEFRTKEIAIRKILGSSLWGIFQSISREIYFPILFACLIAWPTAWIIAHRWLENFSYRIELLIWPFLVSGLTMIGVAFFTVYWHAVQVAAKNPVETLRHE